MRITLVSTIFLCLSFIGLVAAQTNPITQPQAPDLTGTWEYVGELPRDVTSRLIVVSQNGEEIVFEEVFESQKSPWRFRISLFTDKRGEKNDLPVRNSNERIIVDSRTSWNKDKLVRTMTYTSRFESSSGSSSTTHRDSETYRISKDGMLVIEAVLSQDGPFGSTLRNLVKRTYRRKV